MSISKKVYIAASFEQRPDVVEAYKLFQKQGYTISSDWTKHKEIATLATKKEQEELSRNYAVEDTNGVAPADIYVLLLGNRKSTGAHIELGIALGANVPQIFIVARSIDEQLFYRHPSVKQVQTISQILEILESSYQR
jgi:hypothetical protein